MINENLFKKSISFWNLKNDAIVFKENQRILKKHTFGKRINS